MQLKTIGLGLGAFAAGAAGAAAVAAGLRRAVAAPALFGDAAGSGDEGGTLATAPSGGDGHVPTDLLAAEPVTPATRAPEAFRPDPTAVPTAAEREALRPATGPAPTLVADRGGAPAEFAA
jgi:hypothetical protein